MYVLYGMNQYTVQLGKASLELNMVHDKVDLALFLTVSFCEEIFEGKQGYSDGGAILTNVDEIQWACYMRHSFSDLYFLHLISTTVLLNAASNWHWG